MGKVQSFLKCRSKKKFFKILIGFDSVIIWRVLRKSRDHDSCSIWCFSFALIKRMSSISRWSSFEFLMIIKTIYVNLSIGKINENVNIRENIEKSSYSTIRQSSALSWFKWVDHKMLKYVRRSPEPCMHQVHSPFKWILEIIDHS